MVNAVDTLILKRAELVGEQVRMNEKFNKDISELEVAIEQLAGNKAWDIPIIERYDDENHNQIKASQEEM